MLDLNGKTILITGGTGSLGKHLTKNIFEKFHQIDKWYTGQVQGFGLGLATVKHIINSFGGTIDIKSKVGKGTSVSFSFPAGF